MSSKPQIPILHSRPSSDPGSTDPHTRRRRVSVSGKLLSLFASKPKHDAAGPPTAYRPVISRPQPLERRSSSTNAPTLAHQEPNGRKRDHRQASLDENGDDNRLSRADGRGDSPRATLRPRLDSDASRPTDVGVPKAPRPATRPLKSALKRPVAAAAQVTTKVPLSSRFSHTRTKAALEATTEHNCPASFAAPSGQMTDNRPLERAISSLVLSSSPSTRSTNATTTEHATPSTKKTVTFAEDMRASLKRAPTLRNISTSTNHWVDLASEIETAGSASDAATSSRRTASKSASTTTQGKPDPVFTLAPPQRGRQPVPLPPSLSRNPSAVRIGPEGGERSRSQFRDVLALQVPPTPELTLKREPFRLPAVTKSANGKPCASDEMDWESEKENGMEVGATGFLEAVLEEIARDKEEREQRGRALTKAAIPPKAPGMPRPTSVLKRFRVDILPGSRHTTLWDGKDTDIYAWQGTLEIQDSKPASYFYPRHALHDFSIQFHTVAEPREDPATFDPALFSPSSASPPQPKYEWQTAFTGTRLSAASAASPGAPPLDPSRGIALEPTPQLQPSADRDGPCTWHVRFWVPVPLRLFARAEHRTFVCRAKVTVKDWETPRTVVPGGCVAVGIERLRTGRLLAGARAGAMLG